MRLYHVFCYEKTHLWEQGDERLLSTWKDKAKAEQAVTSLRRIEENVNGCYKYRIVEANLRM